MVKLPTGTVTFLFTDIEGSTQVLRRLGDRYTNLLAEHQIILRAAIAKIRSDFPPIRSLNNCPNNLPAQITPLIGREKALADVCELLRRSDVRFVTLTGAGGVGKTLLALQTATTLLADFADGAFVVDLSVVTDFKSVPVVIATSLGVEEAGTQPLMSRIIEHLREKRLLLLLDTL